MGNETDSGKKIPCGLSTLGPLDAKHNVLK